jgi:hypothetical protein
LYSKLTIEKNQEKTNEKEASSTYASADLVGAKKNQNKVPKALKTSNLTVSQPLQDHLENKSSKIKSVDSASTEMLEKKSNNLFNLKKLELKNIFKETSSSDVEKFAFYLTNINPIVSKLIDKTNGTWLVEFGVDIGIKIFQLIMQPFVLNFLNNKLVLNINQKRHRNCKKKLKINEKPPSTKYKISVC